LFSPNYFEKSFLAVAVGIKQLGRQGEKFLPSTEDVIAGRVFSSR
jgi:hypothetical protein